MWVIPYIFVMCTNPTFIMKSCKYLCFLTLLLPGMDRPLLEFTFHFYHAALFPSLFSKYGTICAYSNLSAPKERMSMKYMLWVYYCTFHVLRHFVRSYFDWNTSSLCLILLIFYTNFGLYVVYFVMVYILSLLSSGTSYTHKPWLRVRCCIWRYR